ncbi:alpha/beta fold hydrolase [Gordonia sp. SL306]|uniref:alpha/beta fold hydrolase n=1 Tax=Gordonia sp. SL306 TaxID=2995145 RepID=UPI00226DBC29|nr:alpha/beta hydrolase [Gordonia sp. SL306]WAC57916.1 alpha/beta hydrolase [Gordonia sp. SL306]
MDDEFSLLGEAADELGLRVPIPGVTRADTTVDEHGVSALVWGSSSPRAVFLHGGGQNAHTWDSVLLALGIPSIAIDLPGHGHSSWRADGDYTPAPNARAVAPVIAKLAPDAEVIVGMSLGGLTAISLAATAPDLVPQAVIVDVTPESPHRAAELEKEARGTVALIEGPQEFDSLDEIIELTAAAAPTRPLPSIRRGVIHNTRRRADGRWVWRYDRFREAPAAQPIWDHLGATTAPMTLVRGGRSPFTTDEDAERFRARPGPTDIVTIEDAGHSVQSDAPLQLADVIARVLTHE